LSIYYLRSTSRLCSGDEFGRRVNSVPFKKLLTHILGICRPYGLAVASYDLPAWILVSQNASGKDIANYGCEGS